MSQTPDMISLVQRAQQGDRQAYGVLYERFQPHVCALAFAHVRDAHEAQELAQEVLVQAFVKIGQLREPAAFPGWLRQITTRMVVNRVSRGDTRAFLSAAVIENRAVWTAPPPEELISREQTAGVRAGMARLNPMDRETLRAFYFDGQSLETISQQAAVPIGTVKRRLHVARKRLQRELEGMLD